MIRPYFDSLTNFVSKNRKVIPEQSFVLDICTCLMDSISSLSDDELNSRICFLVSIVPVTGQKGTIAFKLLVFLSCLVVSRVCSLRYRARMWFHWIR